MIDLDGVEIIRKAVRQYGSNLEAYNALGNIRAIKHPTEPYLLFNYTEKATIEGTWNPAERVARGIIFNIETCELVALPFPKFFNLEEKPETSLVNLPDESCEITAKLDGSLGILYWTKDGPAIATRGSFTGEQAVWATAWLRRHCQNIFPNVLPGDVTLLFEIIYPQNRVVLDYGSEEALYLIGARCLCGHDYAHESLLYIGQHFRFPVVERWQIQRLPELIPLAKSRKGIEGWVARFADGFRVKLKTEEYLCLHRLISRLTPNHVRELLLLNGDAWQSYLETLPDEFQTQAKAMAAEMLAQVHAQEAHLQEIFASLKHLAADSRKAYALEIMREYRDESSYLFALLDGQPIFSKLLRHLQLKNANEIRLEEE